MTTSKIEVNRILQGDCRERLRDLPSGCIHVAVTSPPYWGLRDYGIEPSIWGGKRKCKHHWGCESTKSGGGVQPGDKVRWQHVGQGPPGHASARSGAFCSKCGAWRGVYGLEPTPEMYVAHTVEIFRAVRRVLRDDGTLWLNMGDSYTSGGRNTHGTRIGYLQESNAGCLPMSNLRPTQPPGLKEKDLVGIPWRVALALCNDGWYLRQDCIEEVELYCPCGCGYVLEERIWRHSPDRDLIWHKPNPMPESARDRCTKSHEYLFLLSKSPRYFYDAEAIKEACESGPSDIRKMEESLEQIGGKHKGLDDKLSKASKRTNIGQKRSVGNPTGRNKRSVWTVATAPYHEAHFATFPPELVRPCIRAGTSEKGCCPTCGATWKRVIKRRYYGDWALRGPDVRLTKGVSRNRLGGQSEWDDYQPPQTIGWRPTCECYETEWRERCDVLVGGLAARNRTRHTRKRRQQDLANRWYERACAYADRWLMPREHAAYGADPCIVLDPFGGSGTTGMVAKEEGRDYLLVEAKPEYIAMAERRIATAERCPLFEDRPQGKVQKAHREEASLFT